MVKLSWSKWEADCKSKQNTRRLGTSLVFIFFPKFSLFSKKKKFFILIFWIEN
jgi:hypothetical protein